MPLPAPPSTNHPEAEVQGQQQQQQQSPPPSSAPMDETEEQLAEGEGSRWEEPHPGQRLGGRRLLLPGEEAKSRAIPIAAAAPPIAATWGRGGAGIGLHAVSCEECRSDMAAKGGNRLRTRNRMRAPKRLRILPTWPHLPGQDNGECKSAPLPLETCMEVESWASPISTTTAIINKPAASPASASAAPIITMGTENGSSADMDVDDTGVTTTSTMCAGVTAVDDSSPSRDGNGEGQQHTRVSPMPTTLGDISNLLGTAAEEGPSDDDDDDDVSITIHHDHPYVHCQAPAVEDVYGWEAELDKKLGLCPRKTLAFEMYLMYPMAQLAQGRKRLWGKGRLLYRVFSLGGSSSSRRRESVPSRRASVMA